MELLVCELSGDLLALIQHACAGPSEIRNLWRTRTTRSEECYRERQTEYGGLIIRFPLYSRPVLPMLTIFYINGQNDLTGEKQRKHLELEYEGVNEVNE